jgi:hypothetical protein
VRNAVSLSTCAHRRERRNDFPDTHVRLLYLQLTILAVNADLHDRRNERSQFEQHAIEYADQTGNVDTSQVPSIKSQMKLDINHVARERKLGRQNRGSQVRPVDLGLHHHQLERGAHPAKVQIQRAQITPENGAPVGTEFVFNRRREAGLRPDEFHVARTEQAKHRLVAINRQLI